MFYHHFLSLVSYIISSKCIIQKCADENILVTSPELKDQSPKFYICELRFAALL